MVHGKKTNNRSLNISTAGIFKDAVKITLTNPSQALFFLRTFKYQRDAAARREAMKKEGLVVPPVMIFSITKKCNLNCKGCYDKILRPDDSEELDSNDIRRILSQSKEIGMSFIVVVGGEPLIRKDFLEITKDFKDMIFLVFTNGTLLDDLMISSFKKQKNIIPVLSLEGYRDETDDRRGCGVFSNLQKVMGGLKRENIFFGVSLTVTEKNFDIMKEESYILDLKKNGCSFYLYIEYTPVTPDTEDLIITRSQREELNFLMERYRKKFSALFMAVPGEEDKFGGCLSAGRGFVHINHRGDLEPCPFAPYSDINLKKTSVRKALESKLLRMIRENRENVCDEMGGCSLWAKREWVSSLLS